MPREYTERVPLTCEHCGKTVMLPPSIVAQGRRHCSRSCHAQSKRSRQEVTCVGCGAGFHVSTSVAQRRKYCSAQCRRANEKARITCVVCGKERRLTPTAVKNGARFCSWECARSALNEPRPIIACERCGRPRQMARYRVQQGARYCSWECQILADEEARVTVICEHCGTPVVVPPARARGMRYCSNACKGAASARAAANISPTSIEVAMYAALDALGVEYVAQHPIPEARTAPDAYVPGLRLALYADGAYWHGRPEAMARDRRQEALLVAHGYTFARLSEADLRTNPLETVRAALAA